jgi:predicted RNA-binding protein associated with RNAse of E/G family
MAVTHARQIVEVKRTLDGKIVEYASEPLLVEPAMRAVLLCRIDEPEVVAGGRMTLAPGTLSVGYFWFDRPYNVYHWLYHGKTLVHYINIGRFHSLSESALVWDDYAVDILAYPDGTVEVIDEDEIPETVDPETRTFIADATAAVLAELDPIVATVNAETPTLLAAQDNVVHR